MNLLRELTFSILFLSVTSTLCEEQFPVMGIPSQWKASSAQVTVEKESAETLVVTIAQGTGGYPGIRFTPKEALDASDFSHLAATIRNVGEEAFSLYLRVDNPGHWKQSPWNVESRRIDPGEAAVVRTFFGYDNGLSEGFSLDPSAISGLQLFTGRTGETPVRFRLESLEAAGTAGEDPRRAVEALSSILPTRGILYDGEASSLNIISRDGCLDVRPLSGHWDLRHYNQVTALTRTGLPIQVRALDLKNRSTELMKSTTRFHRSEVWQSDLGKGASETGPVFDSRRVKAIEIHGVSDPQEIESIVAEVHVFERPDWMGNRPPVAGDWALTFDEEFNEETINPRRWNVTGPNYWGARKLTHWSHENVILENGTAALRMEKKFGHHNDDPDEHSSDYTGGYLDTFDKWRQRYGYFEARVKLPTADGLWPAFWLMPDAGREAGPMWKRQKTEPRGMEFDILEHLTGWGPYRYHIAMHWDGYGDRHQSTGTSGVYFSPDEDGFVSSGLLWEPGRAVFYVNGREVGRAESDRISDLPGMIIFTLPIGGWDNRPLDDAQLPADFEIDYVKVWQRSDLASEVDGFFE